MTPATARGIYFNETPLQGSYFDIVLISLKWDYVWEGVGSPKNKLKDQKIQKRFES